MSGLFANTHWIPNTPNHKGASEVANPKPEDNMFLKPT